MRAVMVALAWLLVIDNHQSFSLHEMPMATCRAIEMSLTMHMPDSCFKPGNLCQGWGTFPAVIHSECIE